MRPRPTGISFFPDDPHVLQAWVERAVLQVHARLQDVVVAG